MIEYNFHPTMAILFFRSYFIIFSYVCVPAQVYVHHTHAGALGGQWNLIFWN